MQNSIAIPNSINLMIVQFAHVMLLSVTYRYRYRDRQLKYEYKEVRSLSAFLASYLRGTT